MINNLCHMIGMYRGGGGVATLNKLINIDTDAEEVCNFAHIDTIYIRLHEQQIKTVSICPHYHPTTRKKGNL